MEFRIADTFTDSLAKLTGDEWGASLGWMSDDSSRWGAE